MFYYPYPILFLSYIRFILSHPYPILSLSFLPPPRISGSCRLIFIARNGSVHIVLKYQNHLNSRQFISHDAKKSILKIGDPNKNVNEKKCQPKRDIIKIDVCF